MLQQVKQVKDLALLWLALLLWSGFDGWPWRGQKKKKKKCRSSRGRDEPQQ